ncbi:MAG: flagellar biosynthesis protein FliQ [Alphaproteobacteria bacterium]|nr:flagellar biosynthesis protein FliQ [Alphaproteobacteria bacterium]
MTEIMVVEIGKEAIYTLLLITGPLLLIAMIVGLLISLFQTLTQIQEMTLVFVPKILLVCLALIFLLPFMIDQLKKFAVGLFDRIIELGI